MRACLCVCIRSIRNGERKKDKEKEQPSLSVRISLNGLKLIVWTDFEWRKTYKSIMSLLFHGIFHSFHMRFAVMNTIHHVNIFYVYVDTRFLIVHNAFFSFSVAMRSMLLWGCQLVSLIYISISLRVLITIDALMCVCVIVSVCVCLRVCFLMFASVYTRLCFRFNAT